MRPLVIALGIVAVSLAVWLSATAKNEAGDTSDRIGVVERVIACEHPRSDSCRHLAVKAVSSCVKFQPCRQALLARNVKEVKQRTQRALGALEGGDANGSPRSSGSG